MDSAASPGIVDALIRAEAMRTMILLMSGLQKTSCYEKTYMFAGLSSIARGLLRVRLWLRHINLGLEKGEWRFQMPAEEQSRSLSQRVDGHTQSAADGVARNEQLPRPR
jgi:hypothetical protein